MTKSRWFFFVFLGVLAILVLPYSLTVSPDWEVQVVDGDGSPVPGALVEESALHSTLNVEHAERQCTGSDGVVHLPRYSVMTTRWALLKGTVLGLVNPHGSIGPRSSVWADRLGYGEMLDKGNLAEWRGKPDRLHTTFVLQHCPDGFTGYKCKFDYGYYFGINGRSAQEIAACQSAP